MKCKTEGCYRKVTKGDLCDECRRLLSEDER